MSDVFYPSIIVNLRLRFDENFLGGRSPMPDAEIIGSLNGDTRPDKIAPATKSESRLPTFLSQKKDGLSHIAGRLPISGTVELNSFRQAARFNLTFKWSELPIDPRLLRFVGVEIFMGAIPAADFSTGVTSLDGNTRRSYIKQTPDNSMLVGVVDEVTYDLSSRTNTITISGRDIRSILIDSPVSPTMFTGKKKLNLDQPITKVLEDLIAQHPHSENMHVKRFEGEWLDLDGNIVSEPHVATKDNVTAVNCSPSGDGASHSTASGSGGTSFWSLITTYCELVAAVPYFVGEELRVRPAAAIWSHLKKDGFDPGTPTPFKDGKPRTIQTEGGQRQEAIRLFVYGRNAERVTATRKFAGYKTRAVQVYSYDTSSTKRGKDKLITATFPEEGSKHAKKGAGSGKKNANLAAVTDVDMSGKVSSQTLKISRPGIKDKKQLLAIAKAIYEELGRHDISGTVETKNLASFGGDNDDPDLMHLRPGDPVRIVTDLRDRNAPAVPASTFLETQRSIFKSFEEAVAAITKTLGDENLARAIVASTQQFSAGVADYYIVQNVKYDFNEKGVRIACEFANYIEVRQDVTSGNEKNMGHKTRHVPKLVKPENAVTTGTGARAVTKPDGSVKVEYGYA